MLFQFPWVSVCNSEPTSQRGLLKNAAYILNKEYEDTLITNAIFQLPYLTQTEKNKTSNRLHTNEETFSSAPLHIRKDIGHTLDNIVLYCKFYSQKCDENFTLLQSPKYFNCYTFQNSDIEMKSVGVENGLSLILKGEEISTDHGYNTISNNGNTKSLRVAIHEPNTLPNLLDNSLELVPGYSTSVALSQIAVERINTVNSKCSSDSWIQLDHYENYKSVKQNFFTCVQNNIVKLAISICKCIPAIIPIYAEQNSEHSNYPYCLLTNVSDINDTITRVICETQVLDDIQRGVDFPCVWNCNEIKYSSDISYSTWPPESVIESFLDQFILSKPNSSSFLYLKTLRKMYDGTYYNNYNPDKVFTFLEGIDIARQIWEPGVNTSKLAKDFRASLENKTVMPSIKTSHLNLSTVKEAEIRWVKETFYRLNVHFKDPTVEVHKQVLNYSPADLWSGVGGACGLWIGCSIITMVEILEFVTQVVQIILRKAGAVIKYKQQNTKITVKPVK